MAIRSTRWCSCREPTFPGCLIRSRPIGMFRMTDEKGGDDKVSVRARGVTHARSTCATSTICPTSTRLEIEHFFLIYKELEPGKKERRRTVLGRPCRRRSRGGSFPATPAGDPEAQKPG